MDSSKLSSGESPAHQPGLFNPVLAKSNLTFHLFPNLRKKSETWFRRRAWSASDISRLSFGIDKQSGNFCRPEILTCRPPTHQEYRLVLMSPPRLNAIFGTNAESRASACRFYRVHFPCYSVKGSQLHTPGTFWFNPELDTLEIHGLEHFTTFANDLWRHDREKKGLRNVSFEFKSNFLLNRFYEHAASSDQLRQVVGRLEHVTFIHYSFDRVNLAFGKYSYRHMGFSFPLMYPRSLPVAGATGSFSRQQDPRPIEDDVLNSVSLAASPEFGRTAMAWRNYFQELRAGRPCVFRFAYTAGGRQRPFITDKAGAMDYLKDEGERWQEDFERIVMSPPKRPLESGDTVPEVVDSELQTAFGFWTFPLESRGPFDNNHPLPPTIIVPFCDFSAYQPELCVFHL